jgi:hypothetical protein
MFLEVISRIFFDHIYFEKVNIYSNYPCDVHGDSNVDILFIGSSRVTATINANIISRLTDNRLVINAGRGWSTPAIQLNALVHKLERCPEFIQNSLVIMEYPGYDFYTEAHSKTKYDVNENMPHLLLPYLDIKTFFQFIGESNNNFATKFEMTLLFLSSSYRTYQLINENWNKELSVSKTKKPELAKDGGIRNDNLEIVRQKAINFFNSRKHILGNTPNLTVELLNSSNLAYLNKLVKQNNGKLLLYQIPTHSQQKNVYDEHKLKINEIILKKWLVKRNIGIYKINEFKYDDNDFPDIMHLSKSRRDEFSEMLVNEMKRDSVLIKIINS